MPKLGSKKTRTGCAQCKKRRVKCDEQKPACTNCARYGHDCQYLPITTVSRPQRSSEPSLSPAVTAADLQDVLPDSPFTFDQLDLSLMHYWTIKTSASVSRFPHLDIWRVEMPRLAYDHVYLMQGIIAVAALHRAHNEPHLAETFITKAVSHLNAGLPRLMELVNNLDNESPDAIIAFTAIVVIYSTSLPSVRNIAPQDPISNLLEVFHLIQGTRDVVAQTWERALEGPLRAMFHSGIFEQKLTQQLIAEQPQMLKDYLEQLDKIESLLNTWNGADQSAVAETLAGLQNLKLLAFHELATKKLLKEPSNLFLWPAFLGPGLVRLFHNRKAPAMALLVYYAFLLDSSRWSLANWRRWVIDAVDAMQFDGPWYSIIRWPIEKYHRQELPKLIEMEFGAEEYGQEHHDACQ